MAEIKGADLLAKSLKEQGVEYMFGVVGFPVGPLAEAAQKAGLPYIGMRNEQTASYAAGAVGYLTGRPGSCIVVTGPGVIHGLAGLANAQQNCWPMLLIGGASETYRNGMGAFQEERQVLAATPLCKWAHGIEHVHRIPFYVEMAVRQSIYGRPGAAYLDIADDIITGSCDDGQGDRGGEMPRSAAHPDDAGIRRASAGRAAIGATAAGDHRQGHGLLARRGRGARVHRADRRAVPRLADGQGRDARRPSAVGRRGAQPGAATGRCRLPDGRALQLDHAFRPAAALQQGRARHPARHRGGGDAPEQAGRGRAGRRRQGDRRAAQSGAENRQWFYPKETPWHAAIAKKSAENAAAIAPQIADDSAPGGYYRLLRDVAAWVPKNAIICSEGASTMDIGRTQLPNFNPRSRLDAGSYGTMGVGLGFVIAACVVHPDKPIVHVSGDSAIGFSGMEMETMCRYGMPAKIVVFNNGGIGPGMEEIPDNPMLNMRPNSLIWGARYDLMMEAFGGKGFYVEDPKDLRGALDEAMNFKGPALVNVKLSLGSQRKAQEFRWHSSRRRLTIGAASSAV
jgi:2-hydroxyacyl-CoA lyase 1